MNQTMRQPMSPEHPHVEMLRRIYADLTSLKQFADESIVLHSAERELPGQQAKYVGIDAVAAKEEELIRLCDGTLLMKVDQIIANDYFGAVTGMLLVEKPGQPKIAMPFCGLWRFQAGRIVEHWENAYDVDAFGQYLDESNP